MKNNRTTGVLARHLVLLVVLVLGACVTVSEQQRQEALSQVSAGNYEQGIASLEALVAADPENRRARLDLVNARSNYVNRLIGVAENERVGGKLGDARKTYLKAQAMEPGSERIRQGLEEVRRDERHAETVKVARAAFDKGDTDSA